MKFSIIVPVYNVENYLRRCLNSIIAQTYKNFEIIIVNDGSLDNSQHIIEEYQQNYPQLIKSYIKENGGLSDARNYGISKSDGDFIVFVDSDDYIDTELLSKLNALIENSNSLDIVGYNAKIIYPEDPTRTDLLVKPEFYNLDGINSIKELICGKQYFEPAWLYAFNRNFWLKNNFQFAIGKYHEDFGLIPEAIIKAQKVSSLNYIGYYYIQTNNSIMRTTNVEKINQKAFDILYHFERLYTISTEYVTDKSVQKLFNSYIANAVINQVKNLSGSAKHTYLKEIHNKNILDLLLDDSLPRKLKKQYLKFKYKY